MPRFSGLSRFSEIVLSFQDIVLGQMYGHVNVSADLIRSFGPSER